MNLHKRSCCSTWVPRKTNMEFAKDLRKMIFYSRRMAVPGFRNFDQPPNIYIYICTVDSHCISMFIVFGAISK